METLFFSEQVPVKNLWDFKNDFNYSNVYEEKNGFIKFRLCGFLILNNYLIIVLPKGVLETQIPDSNKGKATLLLNVLMKYEKNAIKAQSIYHGNRFLSAKENIFATIADIIKDYKLHGIIATKFKRYEKNGNGKINWTKTFNSNLPIIQKKQLIHVDIVTEKKLKTFSEEITQLHLSILKEIEYHFGWLFKFKLQNNMVNYRPVNIVKAKKILKKAMILTFNTSDLNRYKMMYSYISKNFLSASHKKTNTNLLYAFKFDMVWEEMGKSVYEHSENISAKVPQYKWVLYDKREEYRYQRPDILVEDEQQNLLIIDAKYYNFDGESGDNNLPSGPDMGKQLLYLHSLKALNEFKEIYNVFVIPASLPKEKPTNYFATGSFDNKNLQEIFGNILTYQVDCITMMEHYLENSPKLYEELKQAMKDNL